MILRTYEDIREHLRSFGLKDLGATQNPNLGLTALRDSLIVPLLSKLEQLGDFSWNVLRNMRGQILGYNRLLAS